ncbi:MAG TPA: D-alanyl-D-alanine carboxypeptidase/D-alanyl-D-alanine-endopeptidase [Candidatus Sumerlaeota bacterium]|nr:MAG: D-alanyl-D-alanine carboxypeptidase DacC precursor [candidate division BRC1 bacterium ADurb.Bin183]HOE63151.1 D-alanyl-D-alanine carboxypeptidase/D-alanyl-D-alanine-endopeptidase [Candidatus Sumerlaeota bacterium]HRR31625.1 D-alanyl-D-alanine carboxypeptidase/D-alanyl-D-alanine-endopeptidase [Candidatus Sumerlaeia bacterium]HON51536.1 D-alanyl-D-alanine carboxypeptidase/D-alanyl-D-alanine-endopeptidase [Candidatus Sumerlaeota bacterium]HOR65262.1 D-alanyl-D-alanine carboxypeptidase/D-al
MKKYPALILTNILLILFIIEISGADAKKSAPAARNKQPQSQRSSIKQSLDNVFDVPEFADSLWGVCVQKLDGETLYDYNGNKWMLPASNMKIYSGAAALDILGENFRYETRLEAIGSIGENGSLKGHLLITGSGDPSLGSWHIKDWNGSAALLKSWAEELKKKGIQSVEGNIIGDGRYFTDEYYCDAWEIDDIPYWYSAGSSGLAIEENCFRFTLAPGKKVGDKALLTLNPGTQYVTVINEVITKEPGSGSTGDIVWRGTDSNVIRFAGTVALDAKPFTQRGSVWDGACYTAFLLKEALQREGIAVAGKARNIRDLPDAASIDKTPASEKILIAVHQSPPLSDFLPLVNKISHNFFADHLLRTIGRRVKGQGDFKSGADAVKAWLKKIGAPNAEKLVMEDGCGLSRRDFVQPRQTCAILRYMYNKETLRKTYYESLSFGGVDGELKYRMSQPPLYRNVRAKAGYIAYTRCLSGYVKNADGEILVFSMMCNQLRREVNTADKLIDAACKILAEYSEK